jgi:hypothetical protein
VGVPTFTCVPGTEGRGIARFKAPVFASQSRNVNVHRTAGTGEDFPFLPAEARDCAGNNLHQDSHRPAY